jgi:membrane protein implicated in regulation of membrane protease activity
MTWWMWMILGLLLMLAELATPGGFYVIFFGASAIVLGLLSLLGIAGPQWFQWLLFTALSVLGVAVFRQRLLKRLEIPPRPDDLDTVVGKVALVVEAMPPGSFGRVEMRGTAWSAKNIGPQPLASGERVKVEQVDGLILGVRSDG